MSYMSIFNEFNETVIYDKDMFHCRITDDFSMLATDSITADNHDSTLGTGTNDLKNDTGVHTNLLLWSSKGSFWIVCEFHCYW